MIRFSRVAPLVLLASVTVAGACRRPAPPPPVVDPVPAVDTAAERRAREAAEAERRRQDSIAAANRAREEAERRRTDSIAAANARRAALRNTMIQAVYFDLDRSDLRDDARQALEAKVPILRANPNLRIRIAGHADERGSDEYNMALGQRRAASARRYLVSQGIAENRIEIISFGEERPAATGSDESAWAQNRRAEFEIISGGDMLVSPGM